MPSQKLAIARPETVIRRSAWSSTELRQSAETTPRGIPTSDREHHRDQGQLDGGGQPAREVVGDGARRVQARAEIAAHEPVDVVDELDGEGPVEAELTPQRRHLRRRGGLARHERDRVGGDDPRDHERDGEQAEQRRREPHEAADHERQGPHRSLLAARDGSRSCKAAPNVAWRASQAQPADPASPGQKALGQHQPRRRLDADRMARVRRAVRERVSHRLLEGSRRVPVRTGAARGREGGRRRRYDGAPPMPTARVARLATVPIRPSGSARLGRCA